MTDEGTCGSARKRLERETRDLHLRLHVDPLLSLLSSPSLTDTQYRAALTVFMSIHTSVERSRDRHGLWPAFSLRQSCKALSQDLRAAPLLAQDLRLDGAAAVLGGLYVVHGSGFGRNIFGRNIRAVLPSAPTRYVSQATTPRLWRALCAELDIVDRQPGGFAGLMEGARRTFERTSELATTSLHALKSADGVTAEV